MGKLIPRVRQAVVPIRPAHPPPPASRSARLKRFAYFFSVFLWVAFFSFVYHIKAVGESNDLKKTLGYALHGCFTVLGKKKVF